MTHNQGRTSDESLAAEKLAELQQRRGKLQRGFYGRQPKRVSNVIAQLVQRKGYAQVRAASNREDAWRQVLAAEQCEEWSGSTCVGPLKRGVLEIQVASSLLMQELTFIKEKLLKQIQETLPDDGIKQIKFRVGQID